MKIKIIDLLNKIANDEEVPYKIMYAKEMFIFNKDEKDYIDEDGDQLFSEYDFLHNLNDEVEILEATIIYKPYKIEKLEDSYKLLEKGITGWTINEGILKDKINEIIEALNER